jgi:hypothetical protein
MRRWSDVLAGLVAGGFLACAYLLAGPLTLVPGLLVWGVGLGRHRNLAALAASCAGFGAVWVLLIGQATWRCADDPTCIVPGFTAAWLAPGFVLLGLGAVLGLAGRSRRPAVSHRPAPPPRR